MGKGTGRQGGRGRKVMQTDHHHGKDGATDNYLLENSGPKIPNTLYDPLMTILLAICCSKSVFVF